jgi:ATP-dependent metalloprotease FtsH
MAAIALLLGLYVALLAGTRPNVSGDRLRLDQFISYAQNDRLLSARLLDADSYAVGRYERADGSTGRYAVSYLSNNTRDLVEVLIANGVPTVVEQQFGKTLVAPLTMLLPALIIVVVLVYMIVAYRRGTGLFAITSRARRIGPEEAGVTFADVAAQDEAVAELREVSEFLKNPERFLVLGARIPKGILLFGPPGCGKTLLARALAGEAGAAVFTISGSDFVELYVGVGAARVRDLFEKARANAPAIVFIDELDSIARRRRAGMNPGSQDEQEQALNQILAEMDGFSPTEGIIVIGATNRPDVLDPALLRPGRFDRSVGLSLPDAKGRLEILELHARGKPLAADCDLGAIARRAVGMTGADLANVVNEAALLAGRRGARTISQGDLESALGRILEAPERQRRLSLRERQIGHRSLADERVTFADVAGVEEVLEELAEVRTYLLEPQRFTEIGARVPRGFLLVGPPGCGKTLLARAVAGETNAAFYSVAGSEFTEVFVGEGAARVRDLFAQARSTAPSIVFIDEIDAIGGRRSPSGVDLNREVEQTLNQVLVELDGFSGRENVVVLAATNRPDMLDPALTRPGRFDRMIAIDPPSREGRRAILAVHARGKHLAPEVDLDRVAALTTGFSGADLANVLNEAALLSVRKGSAWITMAEIEEGIERTLMGLALRGRKMTTSERRLVAFHEAGHALVASRVPGASPPHKLTILPRGRALGYLWHPPEEDRHVHTRSELIAAISVALGGLVAEEVMFGEPSDGAAGDLQKVTETARRMVCELGMSARLGPLSLNGADGKQARYSERTARLIDEEVAAVVEEAKATARRVIQDERARLERVAQALLERETLAREDLAVLLGAPAARP